MGPPPRQAVSRHLKTASSLDINSKKCLDGRIAAAERGCAGKFWLWWFGILRDWIRDRSGEGSVSQLDFSIGFKKSQIQERD